MYDPAGVRQILPSGPQIKGVDMDVDIIVYATGFDSMDGAMNGIDIQVREFPSRTVLVV
jgi:hypothetical protein